MMTRPKHTSQPSHTGKQRSQTAPHAQAPFRLGFRGRAALFLILAGITVAAVVGFWPRTESQEAGPFDQMVEVTMAGYSTPIIAARAGASLRVLVVNPDSSAHTDGGGWHQLAIPALGLDARIAPRTREVVEIPAAAAGDYPFYCDICCGGKENPTMQGILRVLA